MTLSDYSHLKEKTVFSVASCAHYVQLLENLKEFFKKNINSVRRYETITSIRDLIAVLETRDTLSEDDVSPLKHIVGHIPNNNELIQKIIEYEENHLPVEQTNYYAQAASQTLASEVHGSKHSQSYISSNPYIGTISLRKKQRIFDTIIAEIGIFWRDFGRNLKIQEGVIDEIDMNNPKITIKVTTMLEHYEHTKVDPQRWFLWENVMWICEALEASRRRDLSRKLQDIMRMNF